MKVLGATAFLFVVQGPRWYPWVIISGQLFLDQLTNWRHLEANLSFGFFHCLFPNHSRQYFCFFGYLLSHNCRIISFKKAMRIRFRWPIYPVQVNQFAMWAACRNVNCFVCFRLSFDRSGAFEIAWGGPKQRVYFLHTCFVGFCFLLVQTIERLT